MKKSYGSIRLSKNALNFNKGEDMDAMSSPKQHPKIKMKDRPVSAKPRPDTAKNSMNQMRFK